MPEKSNYNIRLKDYLSLVKYKLSLAVAFSSVTGYFIFSNRPGSGFLPMVLGICFLTAGSAILNQYTERNQDALMPRTMKRPITSKIIPERTALIIMSLLLTSGSILLVSNGIIPFVFGCTGILMYNLIYTFLKKKTVLAIIPGALVGSIPPLIGYTSAGGTTPNNEIIFFSIYLFLWQIPHFWLLLLQFGKEYQNAGFRTIYDFMNEKEIRALILIWIFLSISGLSYFVITRRLFTGSLTIISIFTLLFIILFPVLFRAPNGINKQRFAFILFNLFSFGIMILLIIDSIWL